MIEVKKLPASASPEVKTVTVRILSGVVLAPGLDGEVGDVYELPRHMATPLVAYGQAELVDPNELAKQDAGTYGVRIETPTTRDPKPRKKSSAS